MSNYELLSIVVESLIRKTAELEQKNADLGGQVKKSNEEKQSLQFALELQEDINHSLRDDLKKRDTEITDLKEKNAILENQIQKSNQQKENLESESNLQGDIPCCTYLVAHYLVAQSKITFVTLLHMYLVAHLSCCTFRFRIRKKL